MKITGLTSQLSSLGVCEGEIHRTVKVVPRKKKRKRKLAEKKGRRGSRKGGNINQALGEFTRGRGLGGGEPVCESLRKSRGGSGHPIKASKNFKGESTPLWGTLSSKGSIA